MNEQAIFIAALQESAGDRSSYLDRACGADQTLRHRVEKLLSAYENAGSFLDDPAVAFPAPSEDPLLTAAFQNCMPSESNSHMQDEGIGTVLGGKYKLVEVMGEGGMGSVYKAEQTEPVRRDVAIKVIKAGMDSKAVLARFGAERQALAMMDHPNIARVLDAGATDSGRPYFVMELVKGSPITRYCDEHRLTPRQRLELFVPVCQAIQHAHQKGVIHRDIKPSNILVAQYDDRPVPKVIDFGVAKATGSEPTGQSMMTGLGMVVGTPEYMSPEQANITNVDIDTRSDVYSLGVLLYELLTGSTPVDRRALGKAAILEILRIVREVDAPKPSAKLSTIDTLPSVAANRGIEPAQLSRLMKGELDWVVLKALEKDRNRRYATANGLARDIQRYLDDEVVEARPPSAGYRMKKFVRRNKGQVIAAGFVLLTLVGGIVGTSIGIVQALKAQKAETLRAEAEARQRERAETAEAETKKRANELQEVLNFQTQMLKQVDPTLAGLRLTGDVKAKFDAALAKASVADDERARQVEAFASLWSRVNATDTARELIASTILQPAADAIDSQFKNQPTVDASLRHTLAERYFELGMFDAALPLQERALETRRRLLGEGHHDTMSSIGNMGSVLRRQGKFREALPYYQEELKHRRRVFGDDHSSTLVAVSNMGVLLEEMGKRAEAAPYHREALNSRRRVLGDEHPETLASISNMGFLLWSLGQRDEAMSHYREALEKRRRVLGEDHRDTVATINHLGAALRDQGKLSEAVDCFREVLQKRRRILGEVHPETLTAVRNLGATLPGIGKETEGEELMREVLMNQTRILGADHPSTLGSLNNLAVYLIERKKLVEAEPMCRESLEKHRKLLGPNHPSTLIASSVMGYVLLRQNKPREAEPYVRDAIAISRKVHGEDHQETLTYTHNLGMVLREQDKLAEAEPYFRTVYEKGAKALGPIDPITLTAQGNLANLLHDQKRYAEVVALLAANEPTARKNTTPAGGRGLAGLLTRLGKAKTGLEQFAEAEANLLEAHTIWVKARGETHKDTQGCIRALVDLYGAWHTAQSGQGYDTKAAEWQTKLPNEPDKK